MLTLISIQNSHLLLY